MMDPATVATLAFVMNVISTTAAATSAATDVAQISRNRGGFWTTIKRPFLKGKRIAFLGTSGVGKTVLLDYLKGKAYKRRYAPTNALSENVEIETLTYADRKTTIVVVPGQRSRQRIVSFNELRRKPVDGIVYVVSNGFATVRDPNVIGSLRSLCSDVNAYRQYKRREELEDLNEVSQLVSDSWVTHKKPTWMLVAPTKFDLYTDQINETFSYYAPGGNSEFVKMIEKIRSQVGEHSFNWGMCPVFTWKEDFDWNSQVISSKLNQVARDQILDNFESTLEKYCKL